MKQSVGLFSRWCFAACVTLVVYAVDCRATYGVGIPHFIVSDATVENLYNQLFRELADANVKEGAHTGPSWAASRYAECSLLKDWEVTRLAWMDLGDLGYKRTTFSKEFKSDLDKTPIDDYGYVWSAPFSFEGGTDGPGKDLGQGWPTPTYLDSRGKSIGYEWNSEELGDWNLTQIPNVEFKNGFFSFEAVGIAPYLRNNTLRVETYQSPFIEFDLALDVVMYQDKNKRSCVISWMTDVEQAWSAKKTIDTSEFAVCRPISYASGERVRAYIPMYLLPTWDGTINNIRVKPFEKTYKKFASMKFNYFRFSYDTRQSVNNPIFISALWRYFLWTNDKSMIVRNTDRIRRSFLFIKYNVLDSTTGMVDQNRFFVGHDDLGADEEGKPNPGHGISGGYWNRLSYGPTDLETTIWCLKALRSMAEFERIAPPLKAEKEKRPSILQKDGKSRFYYEETPESILELAEKVEKSAALRFWNSSTGRFAGGIGTQGRPTDYGNTALNLQAAEAGMADAGKWKEIVGWLDGGRSVEGDDSREMDIYHFRFGPRVTTKNNTKDYVWTCIEDPLDGSSSFGGEIDNGGAAVWVSYYDILARIRFGETDSAWKHLVQLLEWHKSSVGVDKPSNPGILPFGSVENGLVSTVIPFGFLGIDVKKPDELIIAPAIPKDVDYIGVENLCYCGNVMRVVADRRSIDLTGSKLERRRKWRLHMEFAIDESVKDPVVLKEGTNESLSLIKSGGKMVAEDEMPTAVKYVVADRTL